MTEAAAETGAEATADVADAAPEAVEPKPKKKTGKLTENSTEELKVMFAALTPFPRPEETSENGASSARRLTCSSWTLAEERR